MRCVSRSVARAMRGQRVVLGSLTFYRLSLHSERSDAARPCDWPERDGAIYGLAKT